MDRRQLPLSLAGLLLLTTVAAGTQAAIYKWTDAQGKVHFGDKAPDSGATLETPKTIPAADRPDLALSIVEHGRRLPPGIRERAERGVERVVQVYRKVFGLDIRNTVVVNAHIFDDPPALRAWTEENGARASAGMTGVYLPERHLVGVFNNEDDPEETLKTLIHESNHVIIAQMSPNAPLWLHEGLSQYFEGIDTDGERLVVRPHAQNDAEVRYLMAHRQLIQLHDYLAIPANQWQNLAHVQQDPTPYVVAWSLTSFMMSQPFKRQLLGGMLQDLEKAHIPPDLDAFVRRYPGGLTVLEYDWYKWAQQPAVEQTLD